MKRIWTVGALLAALFAPVLTRAALWPSTGYEVQAGESLNPMAAARSRDTFKSHSVLNQLFIVGAGPSTPAEYERPGQASEEVVAGVAASLARGRREN